MLYRIWPGMLSLAMAWSAPTCTHQADGGGYAGASGASTGGLAGATSGGAGTVGSGSGGLGAGEGGGAGMASGGSAGTSSGADAGGMASGGSAGTSSGADAGGMASGGSAGTSSGADAGGMNSGGAGAISGADTGGGTAGAAGASGGSAAGAGGAGGTGGVQQGSFTLSGTTLQFVGSCAFTQQTLTIANTSSVPLTWHASGDLATTLLTPNGSTLEPGGQVSVSVLPQITLGDFSSSVISIDADVAPSQSIEVDAQLFGKEPPGPLPPDIDFGDVPVGSHASAFIGVVTPNVQILVMSGTNFDFSLSGAAPNLQPGGFGWILNFEPSTAGAQLSTLIFTDFAMDVCPPNSITARGVGVIR
jgi:hypothetical protein